MSVTQRNVTRNQSTADYSYNRLFLFNNRYQEGTFKNNTGASYTLKPGTLLLRDTTTPAQVIPAVAGETLANVIGIVKLDGEVALATGDTLAINFAISGDVDAGLLNLPDGVTLDTVPTNGTKTLRDYLQALGFKLRESVQNTNFDN